MRTRVRTFCGITLLTAVFCVSSNAAADPITFSFTVRVDIAQDPQQRLWGSPVRPGDLLTGSYTFDSAGNDVDPTFPSYGSHISSGAPYGITFGRATSTRLLIEVFDNIEDFDGYNVIAAGPWGGAAPNFEPVEMALYMGLGFPNTFSNAEVPLTPPGLTSFRSRTFQMRAWNPTDPNPVTSGYQIVGQVVSLAAVPEPTSLGLLLIGLGGLALRSRRRRALRVPRRT